MGIARDIFDYLRQPVFTRNKEKLDRRAFVTMTKIMALKFVITVIVFFIVWKVLGGIGIERPSSKVNTTRHFHLKNFMLVAVILPFIEELFSRSWLGRVWGVLFIAPLYFVGMSLFIGKLSPEIRPIIYAITLIVWMFYLLNLMKYGWSGQVEHFVQAVFPAVFWFSAASFALLHVSNFSNNDLGLLSVFLVVPQFIGGAFYGYIRMRFGFLAGFYCHGFWNGSLTGLSFVVMLLRA